MRTRRRAVSGGARTSTRRGVRAAGRLRKAWQSWRKRRRTRRPSKFRPVPIQRGTPSPELSPHEEQLSRALGVDPLAAAFYRHRPREEDDWDI